MENKCTLLFPFSHSSPGDPRAPHVTSVTTTLPKLVEQTDGVRIDDGAGVYLGRWVLQGM